MRVQSKRHAPRAIATTLAAVVLMALVVWDSERTIKANGDLPGWNVRTHVYVALTDDTGFFAVPHALEQRCEGDEIMGLTVAFRSNTDGQFHGGVSSGGERVRYSWNNHLVAGIVESDSAVADIPVRIVAFTTRRVC